MFHLVKMAELWIRGHWPVKKAAYPSDFDPIKLCHLTAMSFGVHPLPGTMLAQPPYHEIEEKPVTLGN